MEMDNLPGNHQGNLPNHVAGRERGRTQDHRLITSWLLCKINNIRIAVKNKFNVTKIKAKTYGWCSKTDEGRPG